MYVTRPLSHYLKHPDSITEAPEGPNSGHLVILDEESETYSFFGLFKNHTLKNLPFPQNKKLTVRRVEGAGENQHVSLDDVVLIPVLNLPVSFNRYYAIKPHGSHKGEALTCSTEEDMTSCCFCLCVKDVKPRALDPKNIYQQIEILNYETLFSRRGYFYAKSIAANGFPPYFLRKKGWSIRAKTPKSYKLDDAPGLNATLRARFPDFNIPSSYKTSEAVVTGKWYSPFMFIKDGSLKDQFERSMYYEITLEQRWEQIYTCLNDYTRGNNVNVDVSVDREIAYVAGKRAIWDEKNVTDGVITFSGFGPNGEETSVGLRVEIVQRMKWEQERRGWTGGQERQERVKIVEKFGGNGDWRAFGCFVLVESFVVKRMDGSIVMTYEFWHTQNLRSKWE